MIFNIINIAHNEKRQLAEEKALTTAIRDNRQKKNLKKGSVGSTWDPKRARKTPEGVYLAHLGSHMLPTDPFLKDLGGLIRPQIVSKKRCQNCSAKICRNFTFAKYNTFHRIWGFPYLTKSEEIAM